MPHDKQWDDFMRDFKNWSRDTFGYGTKVPNIIKHIRKELREIEDNPENPLEWIDVIMLAIDGLSRQGKGDQLLYYLRKKLDINRRRDWPPINPESDEPVEHIRDAEQYGTSPLKKAIGPMSREKFAQMDLLKRAFDQHTHTVKAGEYNLASCSRCGGKRAGPVIQKFPSLHSFKEMWVVYCNDMQCLPKGRPSNPEQPISGETPGAAVKQWNREHGGDDN